MEEVFQGRYKTISLIGRGAQASVYLAHDNVKNQKVAIKQINTHKEDQLKMFQSEDSALQIIKQQMKEKRSIEQNQLTDKDREVLFQLDHLLEITEDSFQDDNYSYIVMKYYEDAIDFSSFLKENHQHLTQRSILLYYLQLQSGLKFLHDNQIYHRDLKIDNFLYCPKEDKLIIIDFGYAISKQTKEIQACGTMMFSSPQLSLFMNYSPEKNDIWSMGIVLYYLIFNKFPLCDSKVQIEQLKVYMKEFLNQKKEIVIDHNCPYIVQTLLWKMLARNEENRPQISQLYDELKNELYQNNNIQIQFPATNNHMQVQVEAFSNLSVISYIQQGHQYKQKQLHKEQIKSQ